MSPDRMSAEDSNVFGTAESVELALPAEDAGVPGVAVCTDAALQAEETDAPKTAACPGAASPAEQFESALDANASAVAAHSSAEARTSASARLQGRSFSILGDSISTLMGWVPKGWRVHYEGEVHVDGIERPQDTWWGRVIEHFGGHLVANSSFSGSVVEGFGFPAGNSDQRIAALLGSQGERPDVVLVYMGINDYGWGGGRNQVMGGSLSASARPEDLPGERSVEWVAAPDALDRFEAAYRDVLASIRRLAPAAEIWCLTLCPATSPSEEECCYKYQIRGIELDAYNGAIVSAAQEAGAQVADVRAFGIQYDAVDGCHPSAPGMRQIADMVIAYMESSAVVPASAAASSSATAPESVSAPVSSSAPESIADSPRAVRTCHRPHCHGCPVDDSTDSRWTIACRGPRDRG